MSGPALEAGPARYYTPGLARRKLAMTLFGLLVFAFGMSQLWTPLRLLVFGGQTSAEATCVVRTKHGAPDLVLTDDLDIQSKLESHDRGCQFWNEFSFLDAAGREFRVRAPVGSQLKPLFPLINDDGLPTSAWVCYDPLHPETVIFPSIFSTWFAPVALVIIGLICAISGAFLLYWANTPIKLPHIPSSC